jgi:hypothetical protein
VRFDRINTTRVAMRSTTATMTSQDTTQQLSCHLALVVLNQASSHYPHGHHHHGVVVNMKQKKICTERSSHGLDRPGTNHSVKRAKLIHDCLPTACAWHAHRLCTEKTVFGIILSPVP